MIVLLVIGLLCLGYFILYAVSAGLTNIFTYFWLAAGAGCLIGVFLVHRLHQRNKIIPSAVKRGFGIAAFLLVGVLALAEFFIISYGTSVPAAGADYVIVLGAQVKGKVPSYNLKSRVESACDYLKENPQTMVILSGGQGEGEDISEAQAMAQYLIEKGIAPERMILEEQSGNTYENIKYSSKLMKDKNSLVILVTNDFHVFRSVKIAQKQGLTRVQGIGTSTWWYTVPNLYLREAFAVIKYFLFRQI